MDRTGAAGFPRLARARLMLLRRETWEDVGWLIAYGALVVSVIAM
jgi:hypothetical protein